MSLARNQPPKKGVAMTGELTLTGHVLPIGGVREKVIAARRQKIHELILYLKEGITVHFAKRFADVVKVLF
ncbi:ATP-dependent protease La [Pseudomonas syringae pv. actinidiae ICMP 18804]|nr:ATP-dependent protease La [Pseudomonas syringae pv. actinidiae ICMP 18804]